jgi:hypothetical protein
VAPSRSNGTLSPPWHSLKYDRAAECLIKDRGALLAFYDFRLSAGNICADCFVTSRDVVQYSCAVVVDVDRQQNRCDAFPRAGHRCRLPPPQPQASQSRMSDYTALDQPSQHYQHCRQTENCHCDKYHSVDWHVRQKLDHLLSPLQSPNARRRTPKIASMFQRRPRKGGAADVRTVLIGPRFS